jgi:hypothetical protein
VPECLNILGLRTVLDSTTVDKTFNYPITHVSLWMVFTVVAVVTADILPSDFRIVCRATRTSGTMLESSSNSVNAKSPRWSVTWI